MAVRWHMAVVVVVVVVVVVSSGVADIFNDLTLICAGFLLEEQAQLE